MADYFSHDYHARHDPKMQNLLMKHGLHGVGLFWSIAEFCYEQNGVIKDTDCECIAYDMRTQCELVLSVLNDFGLFVKNDDGWYSESINKRLTIRNEKSNKAAKSAEIRWNNAKQMRPQCERIKKVCEGNAIKDIKVKEIKVNKTKKIFVPPTFDEFKSYCVENGFTKSAERAYKYYADSDWHDSHGNPVRSWKGKLQAVWFKPENKDKATTPVHPAILAQKIKNDSYREDYLKWCDEETKRQEDAKKELENAN